jgi:hypothetical protein
MVTTHLYLVPRLKLLYLQCTICLHGLVLNQAQGQLYHYFIYNFEVIQLILFSSGLNEDISKPATLFPSQTPSYLLFCLGQQIKRTRKGEIKIYNALPLNYLLIFRIVLSILKGCDGGLKGMVAT